MNHLADIGAVDAHAEGVGGGNHGQPSLHEGLLQVGAFLWR